MSSVDVDEIVGMAADLMSQPQNVTASLSPNFWRWSAMRFAAALPVLVADRDALRALVKAVEWEGGDGYCEDHWSCCPACQGLPAEPVGMNPRIRSECTVGHKPDCALALALAAGAEKETP